MIAVFGDIHGCLHTLTALYNNVQERYSGIACYTVGDIVDRGNFSAECYEFLLEHQITFVAGNHEIMFLYGNTQPHHHIAQAWYLNGHRKALASYGRNPGLLEKHLKLVADAPLFLNLPDAFITHAGIAATYRDEISFIGDQGVSELEAFLRRHIHDDDGVLWNRSPLMKMSKIQVIGHTHRREMVYEQATDSLCVDTSAYTGNKLTAAIIENGVLVDAISVETYPADIF